jgi:hypothetical protein
LKLNSTLLCRSLLFLGRMLHKSKKGNFDPYQKWKNSIS